MKIQIETQDGPADAFVFRPEDPAATAGPWPGVLFFMDAFGPREGLFGMARRLASEGYVVLLPEMFHRSVPYAPFDPATAFGVEPERMRLFGLIKSLDNAAAVRDADACLTWLLAQPDVKGPKVGCVGYCMGGRHALLAAGSFPDRVAAVGCFHGGSLATTQPDSPHLLAQKLRARVYIAVAELDGNFKPEEKERLTHALDAAGVDYRLEVYPGVRHGFAVADSVVYDPAAAERHWDELLKLFGSTLR
jgi:carboxymethylenebutenolidase